MLDELSDLILTICAHDYDKAVFPWCVIGSEDIGLSTHFAARVEISDSISTSSKVSFSLLEEIKKLNLPPKRLDI